MVVVAGGVSEDNMLTPMPLKTTFGFSPSPSTSDAASSRKPSLNSIATASPDTAGSPATSPTQHGGASAAGLRATATAQIAVLLAVAIIGPVIFFPIVNDFVGRMALVLVVGMTVGALRGRMVDLGTIEGGMKGEDVMVLAGVYGGVMGVVAALF